MTTEYNGLWYLSMAGGAPIVLSGLNFAQEASWNSFKFEPYFIEGAQIWGPAMSSNDAMESNDLNGRLGYIVPSVTELMGFDISLFNGDYLPSGYTTSEGNLLNFTVAIRNNEDHWSVECSSKTKCMWAYNRDYTP